MPREPDDAPELDADDTKALGALRSAHYPSKSKNDRLNLVIASIFCALLFGAAVLCAVLGFVNPGSGIGYAALLFGGLGIGPAVGVYAVLRKAGWKLFLYDRGFVWVRGRAKVVLWKDVNYLLEAVHVLGRNAVEHELRMILLSGSRFSVLSSYTDYEVFADAARAGITAAVVRRADKAFVAGESVAFGKLLMSKDGLEREGREIAWADVKEVAVMGADLFTVAIIRRGAKKGEAVWYEKDFPAFQNVEAFLQLASRFTTVTR